MPSGEDGQRAEPLQRNDERVAVGVGTWEAKAKLASGSGHPSGDVEKGQTKAFAPTGMKPFGESEDPDPTGDVYRRPLRYRKKRAPRSGQPRPGR